MRAEGSNRSGRSSPNVTKRKGSARAPSDLFRPGAVVTTPSRAISVDDIERFARLTGDENRIHMDDGFASQQLFGGRVAHGLLTVAATLGLWYRAGLFDEWIVVFLGIDQLRFLKPVRPGESLTSQLKILSREPSARGDRVELENTTFNRAGEPVLSFSARLLLSPPGRGA